MCGFIGIINKDNKRINLNPSDMRSLLHHRGPDDFKVYRSSCQKIEFYFYRLSIIDLDNGAQPISSHDEKIISVFNGEIFNFKELRDELIKDGVKLQTQGDSEVIPNLFNKYGPDFIHKLKGMFSIMIWDGSQVHIYRDRFGIKPLYYSESEDHIIFSSEIKPIQKLLNLESIISENGLRDYLRYGYTLSPHNIFENITTVAPAQMLTVDAHNKIKKKIYWDLVPKKETISNEADAIRLIDTKLDESIKEHLVSDVPVGIYLSGGLDSGLLAYKCSQIDKNITAYTLKFSDSPIDESVVAADIARVCGLKHIIFEVNSKDLLSMLAHSLWRVEQPLADSGILPNMYLSEKVAKDGIKVVLSGAGGDEIFSGYTYHAKTKLEKKCERLSWPLKIVAKIIGGDTGRKIRRTLSFDSNPLFHYLDKTRVFHNVNNNEDLKESWFNKSLFDADSSRLYADLHTYIPDNLMLLMDRATMSSSIEGRFPFLDHELVEDALSIHSRIRLLGNERKGLLKKIAKEVLPESVFSLPKIGFNSPVSVWMKGELGDTVRKTLKSERFLARTFWIDEVNIPSDIDSLNDHQKWTLFQLELFCRINIDHSFNNEKDIDIENLL